MSSVLSYSIRRAEVSDLGFIRQLLKDSQLPTQDLLTSKIDFLIATDDADNVIGCIGIECYGVHGFLRSFAVQISSRSHGLGNALYNQLLEYAQLKNVHQLHLLTTTAQVYFERKGFVKTDRALAPESITHTTEFKGMCGSSAVYMIKTIS